MTSVVAIKYAAAAAAGYIIRARHGIHTKYLGSNWREGFGFQRCLQNRFYFVVGAEETC